MSKCVRSLAMGALIWPSRRRRHGLGGRRGRQPEASKPFIE
ncbi:MAG: hypothetical protein AAB304_02555 [Pseudomonadota bacterium]